MSEQPSGALPTFFEPYLKSLREIEPALELQARRALEILCKKGNRAGKGFTPIALQIYLGKLWFDAKMLSDLVPDLLWYGPKQTDHFSTKHLAQIANRAKKLRDEVRKLKQTILVYRAYVEGRIPPGDLLSDPFPDDEIVPLQTLVDLPTLVDRKSPTYPDLVDFRLWMLSKYVKATTGAWNDALLVDILNPLEIQHAGSVDALKEWRMRFQKRLRDHRKPAA